MEGDQGGIAEDAAKHMTTVQLRQCLRKAGVTYADDESQQELRAKVEALGVVGAAARSKKDEEASS